MPLAYPATDYKPAALVAAVTEATGAGVEIVTLMLSMRHPNPEDVRTLSEPPPRRALGQARQPSPSKVTVCTCLSAPTVNRVVQMRVISSTFWSNIEGRWIGTNCPLADST